MNNNNLIPSYKAAVVQAAPAFLDLEGSVKKAISIIREASSAGAKLVAFPETWIPGYPWWIWLGSPAWGMQFVQRYHQNSLALDGKEFEALCAAAAEHKIFVSLGYSERSGGSLYMGQALISEEGELLVARRKLKPTHAERTVFGESDGSGLQVIETPLGRIGQLCCWEHMQPLTKYAMYSLHEQIHIAAWPSFSLYTNATPSFGPDVNGALSQAYAAEGQCYVLAPCGVVSPEMIDMLIDTPDKAGLLEAGGGRALAFGPHGGSIAQELPPNEDGLIFVDIDLDVISLAKSAADPVGHYSRPDVTRLLLNRTPQNCVEEFDPQITRGGDLEEGATDDHDANKAIAAE